MNLTSSEAEVYFSSLRSLVADIDACELFVLPPFTALWVARARLAGSNVAWGAQDVHPADGGAHTGDISAAMLADLGCTYVEVGHAERRRDHGEISALIAAKVAQILRHRMTPILCVGEPTERPTDDALRFVIGQLRRSLAGVDMGERGGIVVAYEPVWAIGAGGKPAGVRHVAGLHAGIHAWRRSEQGGGVDGPVIYGGSVDPSTAVRLLHADGVDGLFVGRAALDPIRFAKIAGVAQDAAQR
jgi:triosephosphate isomerase (TIM)